MEHAEIILKQICIMGLYMAAGFFLYRKKLITQDGSRSFAHLLLYLILPCVVLQSFHIERTPEKIQALLISLAAAIAALTLSIVVSIFVFRKCSIDCFGSSFSNAGVMGFPLITAVLGNETIFYAAGFVAFLNVLQATIGQYILSGNRKLCSLKTIFTNPLVLSMAVGLLLFFTGLNIPNIGMSCISSLANMNAPLAMMVLGVYLAQSDLKSVFTSKRLYWVSCVRLVIISLLTIPLLRVIAGNRQEIVIALAIACCTPVGGNVAVYAQKLDLDYVYAVRLICLSTILSIITIPFILYLL